MQPRAHRAGFTMIELLVVVGIIAILVAVSFPIYRTAIMHAQCTSCSHRMRQLGIAFTLYASDNDGQLPGRVTGNGNNKWPLLLLPYITDPTDYVDPGDAAAMKISPDALLSNSSNHSSFFFNGFNDLGFYSNSTATTRMVNLTNPGSLALLGEKVSGSDQFYMDFAEGNENDVLNKTTYFEGSNYTFADGSVRFIYKKDYDNSIWIVNPSYVIPTVPGHT